MLVQKVSIFYYKLLKKNSSHDIIPLTVTCRRYRASGGDKRLHGHELAGVDGGAGGPPPTRHPRPLRPPQDHQAQPHREGHPEVHRARQRVQVATL